jgi:peptidylprolyl isomerase
MSRASTFGHTLAILIVYQAAWGRSKKRIRLADASVLKGIRMRRLSRLLALTLATVLAGSCAASAPKPIAVQAEAPSPGLQITDTKVGTGASPKLGATCVMHYTGWLYENGVKGAKFDSSLDRGQPFAFPIGVQKVIAGWDKGIATMKVGGKRTLIIPPNLGYGPSGSPPAIPPNATLIFEVELLAVKG